MCPDDLTLTHTEMTEEIVATAPAEDAAGAEHVVASVRRSVETGALEASFSAIASARAGSIQAMGSALALTTVEGDADIRLSSAPIVYAKGNASLRQGYSSAFVAGNEVLLSQAATPVVVARTVSFERAANVVSVASTASVKRGFVGLLLASDAEISEDSRVLLSGKGVLILAAAVLGGFGLIALAVAYSANRVSQWRPNISLPSWAQHHR